MDLIKCIYDWFEFVCEAHMSQKNGFSCVSNLFHLTLSRLTVFVLYEQWIMFRYVLNCWKKICENIKYNNNCMTFHPWHSTANSKRWCSMFRHGIHFELTFFAYRISKNIFQCNKQLCYQMFDGATIIERISTDNQQPTTDIQAQNNAKKKFSFEKP